MSPSGFRRQLGQLVMLGFDGFQVPPELRVARPRVRHRRHRAVQAQRREPGAGGGAGLRVGAPLRVACRRGSRWTRRAAAWPGCRRPFTEWPPMAALGRAGDEALAGAVRQGDGPRARVGGHHVRFRAGARRADQRREPRHRRPRARRTTPTWWPALAPPSSTRCRAKAWPPAASTSPVMATPSVDSHHDLPVLDLPPDRFEAVDWVPFRAAIARSVAGMMVAHVLVPAFDEQEPASLSRRDRDRPAARAARIRQPHPHRRPEHEGLLGALRPAGRDGQGHRRRPRQRAALRAATTTRRRRPSKRSCTPSRTARCRSRRSRRRSPATPASRPATPRRRRAPGRPSAAWREVVGCEAHQALAAGDAPVCVTGRC